MRRVSDEYLAHDRAWRDACDRAESDSKAEYQRYCDEFFRRPGMSQRRLIRLLNIRGSDLTPAEAAELRKYDPVMRASAAEQARLADRPTYNDSYW